MIKMVFHILTLFPEMFEGVLHSSMLGRAEEKGILKFNIVDIRDFAGNKHNRVDDSPYGGGRGMVMQAPPVYDAFKYSINTFLISLIFFIIFDGDESLSFPLKKIYSSIYP